VPNVSCQVVGFATRFKTILGESFVTEAAQAEGLVVARRMLVWFGLGSIRDVQVLCPMSRGGLVCIGVQV
jgi:hypothetical protein